MLQKEKTHVDGGKGTHSQKDRNIKMTRIMIESKQAIYICFYFLIIAFILC